MAALGLLFAGFSIVVPMVLLGMLVVVVVGITSARSESDPHNHRLPATYLTAVSFVLVFTLLFAATAAVASLASLIEDDEPALGFERRIGAEAEYEMRLRPTGIWSEDDEDENAAAGAVAALLVAGAAGGMLWHYRRTLLGLLEREGFREGPGTRVLHTYLYASQFVAVLLLVGAGAAAIYGLAQVVAPGALSSADPDNVRQSGVHLFLTAGALAAGAAVIAVLHLREHERVDRAPTPPSVI